MIYANTGRTARHPVPPHADAEAADAVWLDLLDATEAERSLVERATGLRVPALADLQEIESSSRLSLQHAVLFLSTPMVSRGHDADFRVTPLGFVVSRDRLLTIRQAQAHAFDEFATRFAEPSGDASPSSIATFIGVLEAMVDRIADILERIGGDLDGISRKVFHENSGAAAPKGTNMDKVLRDTLRRIGQTGDLISNIRDSLLGLGRMIPFVEEFAHDWTPPELRPHYKTLRRDLASLTDYDVQLTNKVQFLLDATLGFISIEQNNGIKILTVVSVIGVPPTFIASMYGMNFKDIPELNWSFGYPYALTLMVLSALLPLIWFRRRGWI